MICLIHQANYLLVLTVGTGSKGDYSNLAQGLVNTLRRLPPRLFWLVPSASPESRAVAELVRLARRLDSSERQHR